MSKTAICGCLFLSACLSAPAATPASPKVVFLGDQTTTNWTAAFAANPNWINKGETTTTGYAAEEDGTMDAGLARFQLDVVSLHPAIVHIMFGADDADILSPTGSQFYGPGVLSDAQAMVAEAKAANIQVVFGLEPGALPQYKQIITLYGAQNNIPVINYSDALCQCSGFMVSGDGLLSLGYTVNQYQIADPVDGNEDVPTAAGYAIMTPMAEAVINTMGLTLQGGYLQNDMVWQGAYTNVNTVSLFMQVQFTPNGYYNGGLVEPFSNTNYLTGASGTWASSNPLVMAVNQQGHTWALTPGKTNITYTSPTGVKFNEWTMTVESYNQFY
jgi:hypothetical protein